MSPLGVRLVTFGSTSEPFVSNNSTNWTHSNGRAAILTLVTIYRRVLIMLEFVSSCRAAWHTIVYGCRKIIEVLRKILNKGNFYVS